MNDPVPSQDADCDDRVTLTGFSYRCVCGEVFELVREDNRNCPVCGRHAPPNMLPDRMSETVDSSLLLPTPPDSASGVTEGTTESTTGVVFGHYRVIRKLGQGGMGAVYQALDQSLQRYVALKVIHSTGKSAVDTHQLERLMQEAIAQARVNHPNIVHIYYVGQQDKTPFFAMEIVGGPSVGERLAQGPMRFAEIISIAQQVVDALRHAADYDMIHGDIKPANLLMADDTMVKLSDFGLARRVSQNKTSADGIAGTPYYMSPEAVAGRTTDTRSDMYSLGVTLYEMTFRRQPYSVSGKGLMPYLEAHRTAEVEFPEPWPEDVPVGWRDVLLRLLAKSPEGRYPSYRSLADSLHDLRPVQLPKAGRLQRGLAWLVDLGLASAAQQLFYGQLVSADAEPFLRKHPLLWVSVALFGGIVPLGASYLQARWKTSPGKRLFQLKIVDSHGLTPARSVLGSRATFQLAPIWITTAWHLLTALWMRPLADVLRAITTLGVMADAGCAFFRRDGRSLHDMLFRTRVALNADTHEKPQATARS